MAAMLWLCGQAAWAAETCRFQGWLASTFAASVVFSEQLAAGDGAAGARALHQQLAGYGPADLRQGLAQSGLAAQELTVSRFLARQTALLERFERQGVGSARRQAETTAHGVAMADMRRLVRGLRCPEMSDWRAGPVLARLETVNLRGQILNWGIFLTMVSLVAIGTVALGRIQAKRRRRAWRHSCNIACQIKAGSRNGHTHAVDISCLGAKLQLADPPEPGEPCWISIRGQAISGQVIWRNASFCGIGFRRRLDPGILTRILEAESIAHKKSGAGIGTALSDPKNQAA